MTPDPALSAGRTEAGAPLGVYIHFPFCRTRCPYCDFALSARKDIPHQRYLQAIVEELDLRARLFPGRRLRSVYFGGGTPSLWRPECLAQALSAVRRAFPPEPGATLEVTIECDPKDLGDDLLAELYAAGVNRISLGVQSLHDRHLAQLGRLHSAREAVASIERIRRAGFDNLSVDLMIGLCGQTRAELAADLAGVLALLPEHLSLYQLTVEPRTALSVAVRKGLLQVPETDVQADYYDAVRDTLTAAGFVHYEISSFARTGPRDLRAVHNRLYWTGGEYLGLGVSAHSFRRLADGAGERFANPRGVDEYLTGASAAARTEALRASDERRCAALRASDERRCAALRAIEPAADASLSMYEKLPAAALAREALWLGLRQLTGLSRAVFRGLYGYDPLWEHREPIARLQQRGLLDVDGDLLRLSRRGVLFADEVGAQLV